MKEKEKEDTADAEQASMRNNYLEMQPGAGGSVASLARRAVVTNLSAPLDLQTPLPARIEPWRAASMQAAGIAVSIERVEAVEAVEAVKAVDKETDGAEYKARAARPPAPPAHRRTACALSGSERRTPPRARCRLEAKLPPQRPRPRCRHRHPRLSGCCSRRSRRTRLSCNSKRTR